MTATASDTSAATTPAHPSLGHAADARLAPITATRYEVIVGDSVVGSIDYDGEAWIAQLGRDESAEILGSHPSIVTAMRELAEATAR